MIPMRLLGFVLLAMPAPLFAADQPRFVPTPEELQAAEARAASPWPGRVYRATIAPQWIDDHHFWYRNDQPEGGREFILVDCRGGVRQRPFDHEELARAFSKATGVSYSGGRLPFSTLRFTDGSQSVRFRIGDKEWEWNRSVRRLKSIPMETVPAPRPVSVAEAARRPKRLASPDGRWSASIQDFNVVLRAGNDGTSKRLTENGRDGAFYGNLAWSPDSRMLVAFRIRPGDRKEVYRIESSPRGGGRAVLHADPYALPGDRLTTFEPYVIDLASGRVVKVEVEPIDFGFPNLHWESDGQHFSYVKVDRGHQRLRDIRIDSHTGVATCTLDERSDTFIWTSHSEFMGSRPITWLEKSDEFIHSSEKDGWRHLYLHAARTGDLKHRITSGQWVVRGIDFIDEEKRQIWFHAGGCNPGEDPYHLHYYRVNFDGTELTPLTTGDGTHSIQFSPRRDFLIDTYSRVDRVPVHELRRTSDGSLVCKLEEADAHEQKRSGQPPAEVFTAPGRDGRTAIWGIILRPTGFDPAKRYPVVEHIYAGPHSAHVPKSFDHGRSFSRLTEYGFVVVMIDGMGTAQRGKAFHDVCWKNLRDAGFPDRIAWHRAAAAKYPWYDISRVGIYGTSAGGQNAAGALLFHGDFYKAAVAACGCHDNRMDKASWNEQWMGYPVGRQYAESSNIEHAAKLRGKLQLVVGELDTNVPPESTYRFADALIKAGKDFDFVMLPGQGHSDGSAYGRRRMRDFFIRHLHGVEPPERNLAAVTPIPSQLRDTLGLDRFYQKHVDAGGLPVVGSAKVSDDALAEGAWIVQHMLASRPDILSAMKEARVRVAVMAADECTTHLPEHSKLAPKIYWDRRARGLGATPRNPVVSCGEENLLDFPGDPYPNENILIHEFAHAIHLTGLNSIIPTFDARLRSAYSAAIERGLWKNSYAATNPSEYWAEGVQCWFDDNAPPDALHNEVRTRVRLKEYDPRLARLCEEVFGDSTWRYLRPSQREPAERSHLVNYDPKALPRFRWREAAIGDRPRASVQTAAGDFEVELDARTSSAAVRNFLSLVRIGAYHSSRFTLTKQGIIASPVPDWRDRLADGISIEKIAESTATASEGTLFLLPDGSFRVHVGDAQTAAGVPLGRVVKGMDVVRKIHESKVPSAIRRVIRTE